MSVTGGHFTSPSLFGEGKGRRSRASRIPGFKLWLKPKLMVGMVELAGGLIGPVTILVDIVVNREYRHELKSQR